MLETGKVFIKKEASEIKPVDDGIYTLELVDVDSVERPTYDTRNKPVEEQKIEETFAFKFAILDEGDYRSRILFYNFVPSFLYINKKGEKNKLYKVVETLLKREITREEEATGITSEMINSLVGNQCQSVVKKDGEYSNIENLVKTNNSLPSLTEEEKEKVFEIFEKIKENSKDKKEETTNTPPTTGQSNHIQVGNLTGRTMGTNLDKEIAKGMEKEVDISDINL